MDEAYIDEHHVVDRYVADQLSDDEAEQFEEYYFEHPEMADRVAKTRLMREGLQANVHALKDRPRANLWNRLRDWITTPLWAIGAPVATFVLGAGLVAPNLAMNRSQVPESAPIVAEVYLLRARAVEQIVPTASVAAPGLILMAVDVAVLEQTNIEGVIAQTGAAAALLSFSLIPDDQGIAQVVIPSSVLPTDQYTLTVTAANGEALVYEFAIADTR